MAFHIFRDFKLLFLLFFVLLPLWNKVFKFLQLGGLLPFGLMFFYFAGLDFLFFSLLSLFLLPHLLHESYFDFFWGEWLLANEAVLSLLFSDLGIVFELFFLDLLIPSVFDLLFPSFYFFNFLQNFRGVGFALRIQCFGLFFLFLRSIVLDLNHQGWLLDLFSFNSLHPLCIFMRLVSFIIWFKVNDLRGPFFFSLPMNGTCILHMMWWKVVVG